MSIKMTPEQIEELAKELCFYSDNDITCNCLCEQCNLQGAWKGYKIPVRRVIKKWEDIKCQK